TAFLRSVRAWHTGAGEAARLYVTGAVVGTAERPLELYVLRGRATLVYTTVEAAPNGQAFECATDEPVGEGDTPVRVELIDGGVVWYAVECLADNGKTANTIPEIPS